MTRGFPSDPAAAGRKGGKASGSARRAKATARAALRADQRAKAEFEQYAEQLAKVLIDAALGRGEMKGLEPKDRAQFAVKALEYGVGRPRPLAEPVLPAAESQEGLHFSIGPGPAPAEKDPVGELLDDLSEPVETEEPK